jgi:hypothetical protein
MWDRPRECQAVRTLKWSMDMGLLSGNPSLSWWFDDISYLLQQSKGTRNSWEYSCTHGFLPPLARQSAKRRNYHAKLWIVHRLQQQPLQLVFSIPLFVKLSAFSDLRRWNSLSIHTRLNLSWCLGSAPENFSWRWDTMWDRSYAQNCFAFSKACSKDVFRKR